MYLDEFVEHSSKVILEYEEPLKYLSGRGFSKEDILNFKLGFLKVAKIKKENSEDYKKLHDETYHFKSLENRIIMPLRNVLGKVNGLVVRSIKEKKYNLYLLKEARDIGAWFGLYEALPYAVKSGKIFIHEGGFNSIAFSKVFKNSAASLTSFINDQQYDTLRMFVDLIILVYDSDKAGMIGTASLKKRYGKSIESITLGYDDPNSCLQKMGQSPFINYIKNKVPVLLQN
jgi:DNA primase